MDIKQSLGLLADGRDLSRDDVRGVINQIMSGDAAPTQIAAFLMGMRMKGETVEEITAAVSILREKMVPVSAPANAMDIVGTGGDGSGTYNISTASALVVAAAGVPIAKHGNKALSSKSGSSEALQALGVKLDLTAEDISKCISEAGIGFMFAPLHHPAMKYVGPVRVEMGVRTMFNLLGPQSNPAGVKSYLLGVFAPEWVQPVAAALLANGATSAWVVHGSDGMDEITTTGPTFVAEVKDGAVRSFEINPADAGIDVAKAADLIGGDPAYNAAALTRLLEGEKSAYRDIVLMNAGAGLVIAGLVDDIAAGAAKAADLIDSGQAKAVLNRLIEVSNG